MAQQKKMENQVVSQYFADCITRDLLKDPGKDVTTTDLKSTLKPKHGEVMCQIYEYLKSERAKSIILSGRKAAGITKTIKEG